MSGLLSERAAASASRVEEARAAETETVLRRRAEQAPPPLPLVRHERGFDLIAEYKRRAPSAGDLLRPEEPAAYATPAGRAKLYARAGAAAVSVLTESTRFAGSLSDLAEASAAVDVPVMRKDFLVDPYQVFEARAAGASGVLVIVRLVDAPGLTALLDTAAALGMFALIEVFDEEDAERAGAAVAGRSTGQLLVGVNTRDLSSLDSDPQRLAGLARRLPDGLAKVAESGLGVPEDTARAAGLGYDLALVGSALMRARDPVTMVEAMLATGRRGRRIA
jgi:indole-3-glycerol phosphate synthase